MSRWFVFDQATKNEVRSRLGVDPEMGNDPRHATNVLTMAISSQPAVAVVPAAQGKVLVMRTRPAESPQPKTETSSRLAPAGFLGLTDTIDMETEPEQPKKWWQKILG